MRIGGAIDRKFLDLTIVQPDQHGSTLIEDRHSSHPDLPSPLNIHIHDQQPIEIILFLPFTNQTNHRIHMFVRTLSSSIIDISLASTFKWILKITHSLVSRQLAGTEQSRAEQKKKTDLTPANSRIPSELNSVRARIPAYEAARCAQWKKIRIAETPSRLFVEKEKLETEREGERKGEGGGREKERWTRLRGPRW